MTLCLAATLTKCAFLVTVQCHQIEGRLLYNNQDNAWYGSRQCFMQWPYMLLLSEQCSLTRDALEPDAFHFSVIVWWEHIWACSLYVCIGFPQISVVIKWSAWTTDMGTVFQSTLSNTWGYHPSFVFFLTLEIKILPPSGLLIHQIWFCAGFLKSDL